MTLTSLSFYLLVLALLVLYYLVPKRFQWVVLLIGSYAFYAFVCLRYMGFIVITTLTTYFGARGMDAMTAHSQAVTDEWTRCAAFTQQMLPVCEDNTRRYTCEKLDEFSPVFADCR